MKVELASQVVDFIQGLSPEPRRRIRLALRKLEEEHGDTRDLQGPLSGYSRLRIGPYRIIFHRGKDGSRPAIRCLFAEKHDVIYAVFSEMLKRRLLKE